MEQGMFGLKVEGGARDDDALCGGTSREKTWDHESPTSRVGSGK